MSDASTPLMRQYNSIKQQVPNALLMFRLGDFYELFFEDAVVEYARAHQTNNRIAAYMLALDRVAQAIKLRGIYA